MTKDFPLIEVPAINDINDAHANPAKSARNSLSFARAVQNGEGQWSHSYHEP